MDPRHKIPAIALLGLSCGACTNRGLDDAPEGLEGDWGAVELDGTKYPIVEKDSGPGPVVERSAGWELHVSAERGSTLAYFQEYGYGGADPLFRSEYYSELVVDDGAAPKYRLTITGDLVHLFDEIGQPSTGTGYTDTGYADTDTGTGTSGSTGALDEDELAFDEFERELAEAPHPTRAAAGMILDCELKAEQLHCVRQIGADDDGVAKAWTFTRVADEG